MLQLEGTADNNILVQWFPNDLGDLWILSSVVKVSWCLLVRLSAPWISSVLHELCVCSCCCQAFDTFQTDFKRRSHLESRHMGFDSEEASILKVEFLTFYIACSHGGSWFFSSEI